MDPLSTNPLRDAPSQIPPRLPPSHPALRLATAPPHRPRRLPYKTLPTRTHQPSNRHRQKRAAAAAARYLTSSQQTLQHPHPHPSIPLPPQTPPLTLHTPRTHYLSPPSTPTIALLTALIERLYDTLAYALLDRDALDAYDLTLRVGGLRLDFYCVAEVLGVMAVRAVVKRLGQLVQGGLTGVVVGGVEGGRGVGVVVALGVEGG